MCVTFYYIGYVFCSDITRGHEANPVQCVNGVDVEPEPQDFVYITNNCFTSNINVDRTITSLQVMFSRGNRLFCDLWSLSQVPQSSSTRCHIIATVTSYYCQCMGIRRPGILELTSIHCRACEIPGLKVRNRKEEGRDSCSMCQLWLSEGHVGHQLGSSSPSVGHW